MAMDAAENERLQGTEEGKYRERRRRGDGRFLTLLLLLLWSSPETVIKIEGKYDIVVKDDDLEGTVATQTTDLRSDIGC